MAAVGAATAGETPDSAVIVSYGFACTTIYKWLKAGAKPGFGLKALRSGRASDRPPMGSVATFGVIAFCRSVETAVSSFMSKRESVMPEEDLIGLGKHLRGC